jgi:hypothetical protein
MLFFRNKKTNVQNDSSQIQLLNQEDTFFIILAVLSFFVFFTYICLLFEKNGNKHFVYVIEHMQKKWIVVRTHHTFIL